MMAEKNIAFSHVRYHNISMNHLISLPSLLVFCLIAPLHADPGNDSTPPWMAGYREALKSARTQTREKLGELATMYQSHLRTLQRAAQAEGDLESLIVLKKEEEAVKASGAPGEFAPAGGLADARRVYAKQRAELEKERDRRLYEIHKTFVEMAENHLADQLDEHGDTLETMKRAVQEAKSRLAALSPDPVEEEKPAPPPERLGANILASGDVDSANERGWRVANPGKRNKTGWYQEPNSGRNMVFRFEQNERSRVGVARNIKLKPGTTYRITYRARLLRPWKDDVALRGKGNYRMGFRIPGHIYNAMPLAVRRKHRRRVAFTRQPPPDREWQDYRGKLTAHPRQSVFYIHASDGEGDFLIDDIQIRPILPPKEKKKTKN